MADVKVLLVDDEIDFTDILAERMRTRGLQVDIADSGVIALSQVEKKSYDAIVLDLAMPEMDGIETLKRLLAGNPDLQVILLTGRATLNKAIEAVKLGAVEFMEKPADIETLVEKIREAQIARGRLIEKRIDESISKIMGKKGW